MTDLNKADAAKHPPKRVSGLIIIPLGVLVLMVFLGWGLLNRSDVLPSVLLNKPVPEFSLPPVSGYAGGLETADLMGRVSMVNVFASWCVPCRAEHPLFMSLSQTGEVPLYGINYKDKPEQAQAWLDELGNPYDLIGADIKGRAGIEWGVYGVPETYIIAADGTIAYRHVGPISATIINDTLMPIIRDLQAKSVETSSQ